MFFKDNIEKKWTNNGVVWSLFPKLVSSEDSEKGNDICHSFTK